MAEAGQIAGDTPVITDRSCRRREEGQAQGEGKAEPTRTGEPKRAVHRSRGRHPALRLERQQGQTCYALAQTLHVACFFEHTRTRRRAYSRSVAAPRSRFQLPTRRELTCHLPTPLHTSVLTLTPQSTSSAPITTLSALTSPRGPRETPESACATAWARVWVRPGTQTLQATLPNPPNSKRRHRFMTDIWGTSIQCISDKLLKDEVHAPSNS
ncbi:hypothetical protein FIBSPDRAFT_889036 [Athelia psychrophila]|uniref:Uncharacterized protein n=1 Tax=Athelia psychrophila TaxID=1759441 RepID=A0A166MJC4_9AGAM|nr:hypothetical protein FIBSPDRAFT_889036 [Fibularhizoctonia sp. CBS 109695]